MRGWLRWFLVAVMALDAVAAALLAAGVFEARAEPQGSSRTGPPSSAEAPAAPGGRADASSEATPGATPRQRASAADERGQEQAPSSIADIPAIEDPEPAPAAALKADAFKRLLRAYENMEPESAARALAALAERDPEVVVELLMGFKPRTSGAILDALTQRNASLAADLSYEIWRRSGEDEAEAAESGR